MAKIYGERSQYLVEQDRRYRKLAWYCLSLLVISLGYFLSLSKSRSTLTSIFVSVTLFIIVMLYIHKKGEEFLNKSDNYYHGRKGEYAIFYELKKLSDDYLVFQDIKIYNSKGNIDFVVLGPTGIFAIEVKSHHGRVTFNGQNLLINNHRFEKDILRQTMNGALDLHKFILDKTGKDYFINSILVFSNKYAHMKFGIKPIKNVCVVQKGFLRKAILEKPSILSAEDIVKIEKILLSLNKKEYCKEKIEKWKRLEFEAKPQTAQDKVSNKDFDAPYASAEKREEFSKITRELKEECWDCLTLEEQIKIDQELKSDQN